MLLCFDLLYEMQVNHSQRLSEKPLTAWIITESSGKILCAHCDCMAGLGECCSHVASLLSAIEAGVWIRDSMIVTQKKEYWVMPNSVKDVPYAPIKSINFIGRKRSLTALQILQFGTGGKLSPSPSSTPRSSKSPTLSFEDATDSETKAFLHLCALAQQSQPFYPWWNHLLQIIFPNLLLRMFLFACLSCISLNTFAWTTLIC